VTDVLIKGSDNVCVCVSGIKNKSWVVDSSNPYEAVILRKLSKA
jgi:hypothetical protein